MSVIRARYEIAKIHLGAACRQFEEVAKNDFSNFDVSKSINDYISTLEGYYGINLHHFDIMRYGNRLKSAINKKAPLINSALSSLLEKQKLSEKLHDLLVHLTNLDTKALSKKQHRHLWSLLYKFNLEAAMKGSNGKESEKILKELESTYNTYCYCLDKYQLVPEVRKAYELAIKVFAKDLGPIDTAKKNIKNYTRILERYFFAKMLNDPFGYGDKVLSAANERVEMFISDLNNLLNEGVLSEKLYDLLIYFTNLNSESLSKEQHRHLQSLLYKFNLEAAMKGSNDKESEKILKELESTYNIYTNPYAGKKFKFTPEVQTAYELAIKVFSNDSDVATKG